MPFCIQIVVRLLITRAIHITNLLCELSWLCWHELSQDCFMIFQLDLVGLCWVLLEYVIKVIFKLWSQRKLDDCKSISISSSLDGDSFELLLQICYMIIQALSKALIKVVFSFKQSGWSPSLGKTLHEFSFFLLLSLESSLGWIFFIELIQFVLKQSITLSL